MKTTLAAKRMFALTGLAGISLAFVGCRQHFASTNSASLVTEGLPVGTIVALEMRPPLPGGFSSLHVKGTLKAATEHWLVLKDETKPGSGEVWVSRDSVLMITTGDGAKDYKGL